jgi:hypothetical protein
MSFWAYVLYIVAGIFAANGIPHFIKGITGEKHQTPFSDKSSAVTNVLWGSVNFVVSAIVLHYLAIDNHHVIRESIFFAIGGFIISMVLAHSWAEPAKRSSK